MFKARRIVKWTAACLLAVSGLIIVVWGHGSPAPAKARDGADSVRAVKLRLTFEDGHWANVTGIEGGTISVERDGKKLAIVPSIGERGGVELRVFQASRREGRETLEPLDALTVDRGTTRLDRGGLSFGVQVLDAGKILPADALAAAGGTTCCARACNGTLVCGVCVCTDCGVCATHNWCDCNPPAPPEE
jgi:hypothetical protein